MSPDPDTPVADRFRRRLADAVPGSASPWDRIRRHWLAALVAVGLLAHLRVAWPVLRHPRPPVLIDAALFEHAGWYITRGGRLYLDVWEPKPPLPYETTAVVAMVAGGSVYRYHLLNVALATGASVGTMVLVAALADRLTDRRDAAVLAGVSLLLLPGYFYLPAFGFSPKHFVVFSGLSAAYLGLTDRPFWSGAAAAASVGYWQLAAVFPAIVLGLAAQRASWRAVARVCLGGLAGSAVVLAPVIYWGAVPAMIAETVVIPMVVPEPQSIVPRSFVWTRDIKSGFALIGVGGAAILLALRRSYRADWWWVVAGGAWFGVVAFAVDYDYFPDAIPGLAFVALGVAFLYATRPRIRGYVAALVLVSVAVSVGWLGGFGLAADPLSIPDPQPLSEATPAPIPGDGIVPNVKVLLWEKRIPDACHYRMSLLERRWLKAAGYEERCGRLADALRLL